VVSSRINDELSSRVCLVDTPGAWTRFLKPIMQEIMADFPQMRVVPGAVAELVMKIKNRIRNQRNWTLKLLSHITIDGQPVDEEVYRCMTGETLLLLLFPGFILLFLISITI